MRVLPENWLPPAAVERVIVHWTAGSYRVSDLDKRHYHAILQDLGAASLDEPDGAPAVVAHRGWFTPADNARPRSARYAAHTRALNTGSVGLAAACMMEAEPGGPYGPAPLTRLLWERLAKAAAEVCYAYGLQVSERTVLQHGEVERVYGRAQRGKWDVLELPFDPELTRSEVGAQFRRKCQWYLSRLHSGTDR